MINILAILLCFQIIPSDSINIDKMRANDTITIELGKGGCTKYNTSKYNVIKKHQGWYAIVYKKDQINKIDYFIKLTPTDISNLKNHLTKLYRRINPTTIRSLVYKVIVRQTTNLK